jgi:malate dehydrogenase (oxaloacetate-decarboxylating)(NADP+)
MSPIYKKAQANPKRVVLAEGEQAKIIKAAQQCVDEGIAKPILLGKPDKIKATAAEWGYSLDGIEIIEPDKSDKIEEYTDEYYKMRQRKGMARTECVGRMRRRTNYFAAMMVHRNDADCMISGLTSHYPQTLRPALEIIGKDERYSKVSGMYLVSTKKGMYFMGDSTVNINPSAETISDITLQIADMVRTFDMEPRVALLSYSNFGSAEGEQPEKMQRALKIINARDPKLMVDGEMQADTAVVPEILAETYPFSPLKGGANVLIFPNLTSGNIAYKLLARLGGARTIGPILLGFNRSVHVLQRGDEVQDIMDVIAIAVVDAQRKAMKK